MSRPVREMAPWQSAPPEPPAGRCTPFDRPRATRQRARDLSVSVAQLAEQRPPKPQVEGSKPSRPAPTPAPKPPTAKAVTLPARAWPSMGDKLRQSGTQPATMARRSTRRTTQPNHPGQAGGVDHTDFAVVSSPSPGFQPPGTTPGFFTRTTAMTLILIPIAGFAAIVALAYAGAPTWMCQIGGISAACLVILLT